MKESSQTSIAGIASAALGLASITSPVFILSLKRHEAPLFSLVRSGVEGLSVLSIVFLFVSGVALGFMFPRHPLLIGVFMMIGFPLIALAEMMLAPTSHDLWPIEFAIYCILSLPGFAGAFVGRLVRVLRPTPSL